MAGPRERTWRLINALKAFEDRLSEIVEEAFRGNSEFILALNYEDQLYDNGIDTDANPLTPSYTAATVRIKTQAGQPTDRVTLRDENIFHRSFYLHYEVGSVEFTTSDPLQPKLTEKYGVKILGLTDVNAAYVFNTFVSPAIIKELRAL